MSGHLRYLKEWLANVYEDEIEELQTEDFAPHFQSEGFQDILDIDDWEIAEEVPGDVGSVQARTVLFHVSL